MPSSSLLSPSWLAAPKHVKSRLLSEFIGCCFFHFIGSVSPTPATNAVALMALVYFTAKVSGAHLNPAVSTAFMLLGHINPLELVAYALAQILGCITGALWIAALVPGALVGGSDELATIGCFAPAADLSSARIFGWEAFATLAFLLPVFSVVWYTQNKSGYGTTGPVMVGLSLLSAAYAAAPYTGAALNPARAVASHVVFHCPTRSTSSLKFYVLGEFVGACIVPLIIVPWYGIAHNAWYLKNVNHVNHVNNVNNVNNINNSGSQLQDTNVEIDLSSLSNQAADTNEEMYRCAVITTKPSTHGSSTHGTLATRASLPRFRV